MEKSISVNVIEIENCSITERTLESRNEATIHITL